MPLPSVILAPGTTDSVQSKDILIEKERPKLVCLYPYANLGSDTADLEVKAPDDTWVQCTDDNGDIILSATRTTEVIVGPGTYRLNVTTRTASWGAFIEGY